MEDKLLNIHGTWSNRRIHFVMKDMQLILSDTNEAYPQIHFMITTLKNFSIGLFLIDQKNYRVAR